MAFVSFGITSLRPTITGPIIRAPSTIGNLSIALYPENAPVLQMRISSVLIRLAELHPSNAFFLIVLTLFKLISSPLFLQNVLSNSYPPDWSASFLISTFPEQKVLLSEITVLTFGNILFKISIIVTFFPIKIVSTCGKTLSQFVSL